MPKPKRLVVLEVLLAVQRAPGSDVAERLGVDDALLDRAPERGAVGVLGAEVGVPGVQVRVEVDQRDGSVPVGGGPQQRQRDGVVAADGHQTRSVGGQFERGSFDGLDGFTDVERVDRDVTRVGHLRDLEGRNVQGRVVRPQQAGRLPHVRGAEPGPRPVGHAGVERHARDDDVGLGHLVESRQPGERGRPCEPRRLRCIDRADAPRCTNSLRFSPNAHADTSSAVVAVSGPSIDVMGVLAAGPAGTKRGPSGPNASAGSGRAKSSTG